MKKLKTISQISATLLLSSVIALNGFAQGDGEDPKSGTIKISANTKYNKASGFKRIMFGEHYRKEWATAVDVEILDIQNFEGGLTPSKLGGGLQTMSLRLKSSNGKEYVLRSVNKDPSRALTTELRNTFADDVVKDQISSANPFAPMIVAALAKHAGIYHSTPKMVYVISSPALGIFNEAFGETLCLLEERPTGNNGSSADYGFATKIVNSQKMLAKVFADPEHIVDQRSYLKARLFDMLIGDWDRHEDQWLWAGFEKNGITYYKPIPRDRDQAFARLDGIIPQMATKKWGIRKIQGFDDRIKDIYGLNLAAVHLDRNFTTELSFHEWSLVADELVRDLSDQAIRESFNSMPDEVFQISGERLISGLLKRKDNLHKYAKDYYDFLSREVDIVGTANKEIFDVFRINDDSTTVIVYRSDKNGYRDGAIYHRTFLHNETEEIRLYGLGAKDIFHISGKSKKGITVRVIGGSGLDKTIDESMVAKGGRKTLIYDNGEDIQLVGSEARVVITNDSLKIGYNRKSFKYDWFAPIQMPGYNPDDGLYLGAGFIYKKQGFGKAPYASMHSLFANYAFNTGAYTFRYEGTFKEKIGKWDLHVSAQVNAPNYVRNYYGMGNETEKLDTNNKYYRVRFNQVILGSSFQREFGTKHSLTIGSGFQSYKAEKTDNRFVSSNSSKLDTTSFERRYFLSPHIGYQFSTVDFPLYPRKGIKISTGARYYQDIKETDQRFGQFYSEAAMFNSLGAFTFANRIGVSTNIGDDYEFYQANTLGGTTTLRGYRRDRFSGKTSVYQNSEVRVRISNLNLYLMKGIWGLVGFSDHGRVWIPEETSTKWHHGYGAGVWFLPFNRIALTATYGVSNEDKLVNVSAGFLF